MKNIYYALVGFFFILAAIGTVYAGYNEYPSDISTVGVDEVTCPGYQALGENINDPDFQCVEYCSSYSGTDSVSNCCGQAISE